MQLTGLQVGVWGQTAGWCVGSDGWLVCGVRRLVGVWGQTEGWCVGSDGRLVCGVRRKVGVWGQNACTSNTPSNRTLS